MLYVNPMSSFTWQVFHVKANTKEYGLNKELMTSLALFIYNKNYDEIPSPLEIYNEWSEICSLSVTNMETLAAIIEHIRKLSLIRREDLLPRGMSEKT